MRRGAWATLIFAWVVACGPRGDDAYPGLTEWAPENAYRVRYPSPPWELVETEGTRARFEIRSPFRGVKNATGFAYFALTVTLEAGSAADRAAREDRMATEAGHERIAAPRPVVTDAGDTGFELLTRAAPLHRRIVYLDRPDGVLVMRFESIPSLDTPEVTAMILATSARPENE